MEIDINSIWTHLQEHIGLWLACLPTLQPLGSLISTKLGLESKLKRLDSNPPEPDIIVGRSSKRIAPLRIVPGPRIGIAVSTDLESGLYDKRKKRETTVKGVELARAKSIHVHARERSEGIIKTTDVDVSITEPLNSLQERPRDRRNDSKASDQGLTKGTWQPSRAW